MSSDQTDSKSLAPKAITDRFNSLEVGDMVTVNNHELSYEVVDTDTYSVVAEDPDGHRVTFSQNLQSGGWMISEDVFHVETSRE
jgi:hypothetical protein